MLPSLVFFATLGLLQTPARGDAPLAVLPFTAPHDVMTEDALDLLSGVLAAQLAEQAGMQVVSPEELRALLENEAQRQATGASQDDALVEVSQALDAQDLVRGSVARVGSRLVWTTTRVNATTGAITHRAQVSGATLQALAAQADDVALALLGNERLAQEPRAAAKRLGFGDTQDLTHFKKFRARNPDWGTQEALTEYIILNNLETNRLALVEAGLFLAGGTFGTLAMLHAVASYMLVFSLPLGPLALVPAALAFVLGAVGLVLVVSSVGAGVVDALNRGFRTVKQDGCCRDDARIKEAAQSSALRKSAAFAILVGGPTFTTLSFCAMILFGLAATTVSGLGVAFGLPKPGDAYFSSPAYYLSAAPAGWSYACAVLGCLVPCVVGIPLGSLLLFWPSQSPVEGLDEDAP